jgi:catechol 2,3-dioxygenase-like lactoylglutathione lyase family enzyme
VRAAGSVGWAWMTRLLPALVASLLGTCPLGAARAAEVLGIAMTVSDVDGTARFLEEVAGFQRVDEEDLWGEPYEELFGVFGLRIRLVHMRLGAETLELLQCRTPRGAPVPPDSRSHDRWFQHVAIVVRDMDAAYARLLEHDVEHVSTAPQTLPESIPAAAGIEAFYFRDPDGHVLELIAFPGDKGDPRWRRPTQKVFLGLDHSAIGSGDTARSLTFWRDLLGLRVTGHSENQGSEQEHLNLVFGARVLVTGLRGAAGPGVELLDYRTPSDGRPMPEGVSPCDLVHWETIVAVPDLDALVQGIEPAGGRLVSPRVVELPVHGLGYGRALLARDPDGHAVRLVERTAPRRERGGR